MIMNICIYMCVHICTCPCTRERVMGATGELLAQSAGGRDGRIEGKEGAAG